MADPTQQNLPPGVHPNDPSVPWAGGPLVEAGPVNPDTAGDRFPKGGKAPFSVDNGQATAVFERAAQSWTANQIKPGTSIQLIGRQDGRKNVTIWVPSSASTDAIIAPTQGEVDQGDGVTLAPGDSITIATEAPVFGGPATSGQVAVINVVAEINPTGGAYGN
jgi:hypothetical protein